MLRNDFTAIPKKKGTAHVAENWLEALRGPSLLLRLLMRWRCDLNSVGFRGKISRRDLETFFSLFGKNSFFFDGSNCYCMPGTSWHIPRRRYVSLFVHEVWMKIRLNWSNICWLWKKKKSTSLWKKTREFLFKTFFFFFLIVADGWIGMKKKKFFTVSFSFIDNFL